MRATLREVAERAGVSLKTVTNVIHQRSNVRESTRARVQAAIDELGYHPNLSARNLALGRAGTIALAVPQLDMPYFASLAMHVLDEADRHGWFVLIVQTRGEAAAEQRILSGAFPQRLDGVIFDPLHVAADEIRDRSDATPLVLIGEGPHEGIADHVGIDNAAAGRAAVDHLVAMGRTRIGMIGAASSGRGTDRGDGFLDGVTSHGLSTPAEWQAKVSANTGEQGAAATAALLERSSGDAMPDALFCATDWLALGAIRELTTRGIRVPQDIAVVGFDDIPYGRVSTPTLTTIASARDEIAKAAVESLLRQQTERGEPREIVAGFDLVVRESTGASPGTE